MQNVFYSERNGTTMNGKRFSEGKARRNGFYLALAVCLVAVGIAAWSTYDAVQDYLGPEDASTDPALVEQQEEDVRSGQNVLKDDDPEAPKKESASSSAPSGKTSSAASAGAKLAGSTPKKIAPTKSPSPTPAPEESEASQVPATAPLYEISTEMLYPVASKQIDKAYSSGAPMYSETMKDWRVHAGCDIAAESGEQVLACGIGIVKETYTDSMLGNVIVVEHGDYMFYYCGVGEEFLVQPEDVVSMGQAIGTITAVPEEAAQQPHLHLEVRRDGACMDPRSVLEGKN